MIIWDVVGHTLTITAFVTAMMIAVEYVNTLTRGAWHGAVLGSRTRQYLVAVLLGALPGCLGAFTVVALYNHRLVSLGAVVACMIATSGDEAFVMLALFPSKAILLSLAMAAVGFVSGALTDLTVRGLPPDPSCHSFALHEEASCRCFPRGQILQQLRHLSPTRGILAGGMGLLALAVIAGRAGPEAWGWVRFTLLGVTGFGLFVVLTVPEHFLEEHLWKHAAVQHVPHIFLWVLVALGAVELLGHFVRAETIIRENRWAVLGMGGIVGLVPGSGPHLLFVTLYDRGIVPVSTLLTNSIVQDGHGTLPLLAHSRADFFKVKLINLGAGLIVGALVLALGW